MDCTVNVIAYLALGMILGFIGACLAFAMAAEFFFREYVNERKNGGADNERNEQ